MGLAWICPPRGGEKEGSWVESLALTQAPGQTPAGAFWERSPYFVLNFKCV